MTESKPIEIVTYDPEWPAKFEEERPALADAIGDFATGGIHHVGSTAVPHLDAKPIIDILIGVEGLNASRPTFDPLARLGYMYAPYLADEMHWFCRPNPDLAQRYADLKRGLACRFEHDREGYTQAKAAFIAEVLS